MISWMQEVYRDVDMATALANVVRTIAELRQRTGNRVLVELAEKVVVHSRLQLLFNLKFNSRVERSVYELILTHAMAAERLGPGGFDLCIGRLLEKLQVGRGSCPNDDLSKKIKGILGAGSVPATQQDVDWIVDTHSSLSTPRTMAMLKQSLELAGFAGRVLVEKTHSLVPSVELVRGYTFEQSAAFPVSVKLEQPRIFCIDGYVESVSEMHHLLEAAAEAKEPAVVFLRGLADEVKHTLKVNFDRGSLKIVPIIVKFDLEGINTLNDISVVTGADMVSSNKGDLISSIKFHDAPRVTEVIVHQTKVVIKSDATGPAVRAQVTALRRKRQEESVVDIGKLLDTRIRSLSPNHVVIRLPDDKDFVTSSQAIDYTLRAIRTLIDHGTVTVDGNKALTATAVAAEVHSTRCLRTLQGLGALIRA
jgi:hypothetical protein